MSNRFRVRAKYWLVASVAAVMLLGLMPAAAQEGENYSVGVELVAEGMAAPTALTSAHDGSGRLFVADQTGKIWIISQDGQTMADPFLDLTGLIVPLNAQYDERGVLGLAFHPDYANNGRFFVYYGAPLRADAPSGWDHTNILAEFNVMADNPNMGDLASQKTILQIDQPQGNHNAGHIAFGPDGYLYVPIGDGGGGNDTDMRHTPDLGNGQDLMNLHGSILRIDVNGNPGEYSIPSDNPFADGSMGAPEIYAYGFRNPYHISFDMGGSNQLFVADAGQELYEEVDIATLGGNYGWNIKEGTHCFDPANAGTSAASCASTGANGEALIDPIIEYSHDDVGIVVVGGYVYRGSAMTDLQGYYIFGDWSKSGDGGPDGTLLWAEPATDATAPWEWGELAVAGTANNRVGAYVRGLGEGEDGELYVLTSTEVGPSGTSGKVWKLVAGDASMSTSPEATSEAGMGSTEPETTPEASG